MWSCGQLERTYVVVVGVRGRVCVSVGRGVEIITLARVSGIGEV